MEKGRAQALFSVLSIYFDLKTNDDWASFLNYSDASSISRIRNGKINLPESKVIFLCQKSGVTRREFETLPIDQISDKLGISDRVSSEHSSKIHHSTNDLALVDTLTGKFAMVYSGFCHDIPESLVLWIDLFDFGLDKPGKKHVNKREITRFERSIIKETYDGELSVVNGTIYMTVSYPDKLYPPSTFLCESMIVNDSAKILIGVYTDVSGSARPKIFSTPCVLFDVNSENDLPEKLLPDHDAYDAWIKIMNEFMHLGHKIRIVHDDPLAARVKQAVNKTKRTA